MRNIIKCFLLTEIPVSDAQMYLKTSTTIKTGTVRTENNNHNNDRAIVCVVLFLVVGWLHMTTDGLVAYWWRVVSSRRPGGGVETARPEKCSEKSHSVRRKIQSRLEISIRRCARTIGPGAPTIYNKISKIFKKIFTQCRHIRGRWLKYYRKWAEL